MTRTRIASTLALCTALLVGCGSSSQNTEAQNGGDALTGSDQRGRRASTSGGDDLARSGDRDCRVESVYFGYDSSDLDDRARGTLQNNASCLSRRSGQAAVTGMTDPRGTEEYNLALGDRRARTVSQYMGNLGVEGSRMQVHSVGEEYADGEDESGWSRDRRAEIELR